MQIVLYWCTRNVFESNSHPSLLLTFPSFILSFILSCSRSNMQKPPRVQSLLTIPLLSNYSFSFSLSRVTLCRSCSHLQTSSPELITLSLNGARLLSISGRPCCLSVCLQCQHNTIDLINTTRTEDRAIRRVSAAAPRSWENKQQGGTGSLFVYDDLYTRYSENNTLMPWRLKETQ